MASWSGVHPADVAIGIAGVLANIAGPYAGLVDATGGRVQPHLSLLHIGSSTPRLQRLGSRLFHPLRTRTNWLRQRTSSHSRTLIDRYVFGEHTPAAGNHKQSPLPYWFKEQDARKSESQHEMFKCHGLPADQFSESELMSPLFYGGCGGDPVRTSAGPAHLPSLFFEGVSLDQLATALSESIHREALLLNPSGGLFNQSNNRSLKDERLAEELTALLRGRDTQFDPLHPDQGHGTFEHARVHLCAAMSMERLGETLQDESSNWNALYRHCLLWEASAWQVPQDQKYNPAQAWQRYEDNVHKLLELRCFGKNQAQMRSMLSPNREARYQHLQSLYLNFLDNFHAPTDAFISQFHDLPARLLWVFMQFFQKGEASWTMAAAFDTATYATRMHERLLKQARDKYTERMTHNALEVVISILARKGPCKLREMQRASNNRSAAFFKPVLQTLEQQGRLRVDEHNRFQLIGQS